MSDVTVDEQIARLEAAVESLNENVEDQAAALTFATIRLRRLRADYDELLAAARWVVSQRPYPTAEAWAALESAAAPAPEEWNDRERA